MGICYQLVRLGIPPKALKQRTVSWHHVSLYHPEANPPEGHGAETGTRLLFSRLARPQDYKAGEVISLIPPHLDSYTEASRFRWGPTPQPRALGRNNPEAGD